MQMETKDGCWRWQRSDSAVRLTSSCQRVCRHDLHLCVAAAGAGVQYGHHLVGTVGPVLDHGVINGEHLIADR